MMNLITLILIGVKAVKYASGMIHIVCVCKMLSFSYLLFHFI